MINTGGYQVSVMPQYTPVDPRLAAYNPMSILEGASGTLGVADQVAKLRAFNTNEAERALLAQDRIAAAKAGYQQQVLNYKNLAATSEKGNQAKNAGFEKEIATTPGAITATNATNAAVAATAPVQATTTVKQLESQQKDIAQKESLRPITEATAKIKAQYEQDDAAFKQDIQGDEHTKIEQALQYDLTHANNERDVETAYKKAQTKLLLAQADKFTAEAEGTGRYDKDPFAHYQKMNALESQLVNQENKLLGEHVLLPNGAQGTIGDYIRATRKNPGVSDDPKSKLWFGLGGDVQRSPEAEALIQQLSDLRTRRRKLSDQIDGIDLGVGGEAGNQAKGPSASLSKTAASLTGKDKVAYDWAKLHKDDPRSAKILQTLGVQ